MNIEVSEATYHCKRGLMEIQHFKKDLMITISWYFGTLSKAVVYIRNLAPLFWNMGESSQEEDIWHQIVIRSYMLWGYVLWLRFNNRCQRARVFFVDLRNLLLSSFAVKFIDGRFEEANILKKLETKNYQELFGCMVGFNSFVVQKTFYHVTCKKPLTKSL